MSLESVTAPGNGKQHACYPWQRAKALIEMLVKFEDYLRGSKVWTLKKKTPNHLLRSLVAEVFKTKILHLV